MRPLHLPVPTAEQLTALENFYRKARTIREHTRAHMVLLAVEQHAFPQHTINFKVD